MVFPDAQRPDVIVFFIHAIGVAEGFIAGVEVGGGDVGSEKGPAVHDPGDVDAGKVEDGGAEVDELDKSFCAGARGGVDQVFEVVGDADDEGHVKAGLVGVTLAAGKHAAVIAEVKDEGVLEQAVRLKFVDERADLFIDRLVFVVVARLSVAKHGGVGVVGEDLDGVGRGFGLLVLEGLFLEVQGTLMRRAEGLHVEEGRVVGRAVSPCGFP